MSNQSDTVLFEQAFDTHEKRERRNGNHEPERLQRRFSTEGISPFESVSWTTRDVDITDDKGATVFIQKNVEAPTTWSDLAVKIVASKYFWGEKNTDQRENSVRKLIHRVADTIATWAAEGGYVHPDDESVFYDELCWLCINQYVSFNSPVWFNVGLFHQYEAGRNSEGGWAWDQDKGEAYKVRTQYEKPQSSACFIISVDDTMESLMDLAKTEAMLFKFGSGTGTDLTPIRSHREKLAGGGRPSGPMSFLKIYDQVANVVKSGGKCLAPDQLVYTHSGPVQVQELASAGKDFVTLSYDPPAGRVKAKWARAWNSGDKVVLSVKTDKGEFHLSEDHPVKLADGRFVQARHLKIGQALFATSVKKLGGDRDYKYGSVKIAPWIDERELVHRLVAQDILGHDIGGRVVHHKDENTANNHPDNLEILESQAEHASFHGTQLAMEGNHPFQLNRFDMSGENNGMHHSSDFFNDSSKVNLWKSRLGEQSVKYAAKAQVAAATQRLLNNAWKLINLGHDISTFEGYNRAMDEVFSRGSSAESRLKRITDRFGSYDDFVSHLQAVNHRVVSVTSLGTMPVYSVEVICPTADDKSPDSGHNFAICSYGCDGFGSMVFVSNTRRAAKMNILRDWHPDIEEFIVAKSLEERKAWALIEQGYDGSFNGDAYGSVMYQNENLSVRVGDDFMKAATTGDGTWWTKSVTTGDRVEKKNAKDLLTKMAEGAWLCGDPGIQFDGTIQRYHTCSGTEPIHATNPCLTGDMLVDTSEGMIRIQDLAEMDQRGLHLPYAFSKDLTDNSTVLRKILKAWHTKTVTDLVEVTTDKGVKIRCTPDHLFLSYEGQFIRADKLIHGQRLRKVKRTMHPYGRWQVDTKKGHHGTMDQHRFLWTEINGQIPDGYDVHHKDEDKQHDVLSNLELRESLEHESYHSTGAKNPRFISCCDNDLLEVFDVIQKQPKKTHTGNGLRVTPARWNAHIRKHHLDLPRAQSRPDLGKGVCKIQGMLWEEFYDRLEALSDVNNDTVVDVARIHDPAGVKVYDLEVEETHNFGVRDSGYGHSIIVHNCAEYLFIDNTACNLASLNLVKFYDGSDFSVDRFKDAVRLVFMAQDILIDNSSYPTKLVAENAHTFRTIGLGYANLGALLMRMGLPYDSDDGRLLAATITAIMTGEAYYQSALIAKVLGPFPGFYDSRCAHVKHPVKVNNMDSTRDVLQLHADQASKIRISKRFNGMADAARETWSRTMAEFSKWGVRNAQATVVAPTGTIAFMMDCDTTGIEPELSLVKVKTLAGGGTLTIVNQMMPKALANLGYTESAIARIVEHVTTYGHTDDHIVDGEVKSECPILDEHRAIFDTSLPSGPNKRSIHYSAHVKMMALVQPFISGAISKTVNMPEASTVDDVRDVYVEAWKLGLKCVAIYRDNSKRSQPLNVKKMQPVAEPDRGLSSTKLVRRRLPDTRKAITHKFKVGGHEGYLTVGLFDDGSPGELFITMSKEGSTIGGLMDTVGTLTSLSLQHGVPMTTLVTKFRHSRFEPSGVSNNPRIRQSSSIIDYIFHWLEIEFGENVDSAKENSQELCPACGHTAQRSGTCHTCPNCGTSLGCS